MTKDFADLFAEFRANTKQFLAGIKAVEAEARKLDAVLRDSKAATIYFLATLEQTRGSDDRKTRN